MSNAVQTRAVLADAYPAKHRGALLTHSVLVDAAGLELKVLCGRVQLDSLADEMATDRTAAPTCQTCRRKLETVNL